MTPSAIEICRVWFGEVGIGEVGIRQSGIRQSGNRQSGIRRSGIRRTGREPFIWYNQFYGGRMGPREKKFLFIEYAFNIPV